MNGPAPTLKCLIVWSDRRHLCDLVEQTLVAANETDTIRLNEDSWIVCTATDPATLRDLVSAALDQDESTLVVEFEFWSGSGPGVDSIWLSRRGH